MTEPHPDIPTVDLEIEVWPTPMQGTHPPCRTCTPSLRSLKQVFHFLPTQLISGQQLCPYKKRCVSLTVDIQTFGIPADVSAMPQASVSSSLPLIAQSYFVLQHDSAFWPQWERGTYVYKKKILMPELVTKRALAYKLRCLLLLAYL